MKKISLVTFVLIVLSISFSSCKKDSQNALSDYYIKGKKDGVAFNFTSNTRANFMTSNGAGILNLIAGAGITTSEGLNFGINFADASSFKTGTYTEDNAGSEYIVAGVYNPNSTTYVYSAGIQSPSVKPLVINILTKTSTEVSGTFSGAFYKQDLNGNFYPDYITIAEGEFKLQIK